MRKPAVALFFASGVGLFIELALIRWIPNTLHVVGFFANLVLIASFLGLGIGMTRATSLDASAATAITRLAILICVMTLAEFIEPAVSVGSDAGYALNEVRGAGWGLPLSVSLLLVFAFVAWTLVPFGSMVAARFDELDRIPAYSVNVAGSLGGVATFSALSYFGASPIVWFSIAILALFAFNPTRRLVLPALCVLLALGLARYADTRDPGQSVIWSPYYEIAVRVIDPERGYSDGYIVDVNGQFLLSGFDLRPSARLPYPLSSESRQQIEGLKSYYSLPFTVSDAERVLVLGSGAGNDVAAALRSGAESITAVEIDPAIMELAGLHPEQPMRSARVTSIVADARTFLRNSNDHFDLILFATLDAHGLLSNLGSVRLDSFVYTIESLTEAKERLAPGGHLVLSFGPFREDIQMRQYLAVRSVFGQDIVYLSHENQHRTIVAGDTQTLDLSNLPDEWTLVSEQQIASRLATHTNAADPATDDWPHVYLSHRSIPIEYLVVMLGIAIATVVLVRSNLQGRYRLEPTMLLLGAGFLLLETKSVTEFALLAGGTWATHTLVISVVLASILLVNLLVHKNLLRISIPTLFGLLGVSLIVTYLFPISDWAAGNKGANIVGAVLYLGIPILLASSIFATLFRGVVLGSAALASNLIGSVLGGMAEYSSLITGIRALSIIALAMYAGAFLFWRRSIRDPESHTNGHVTSKPEAMLR